MRWTDENAPRLWRSWELLPYRNEPLNAPAAYSDELLSRIAAEGFTGIWLYCCLRELTDSSIFPQLNDPRAPAMIAGLQEMIARAAKHGLGVYLYFNEPEGLSADHALWEAHPELCGPEKWQRRAWCFSQPQVRAWFRDAVASVFRRLSGVAGVILITGSEGLTHCWSKWGLRLQQEPTPCPRCLDAGPVDAVLEILRAWSDARKLSPKPFRIWAWNWEWALWHPDPQPEILDKLPEGVELLADVEFGGTRQWRGRTQEINEYSLGYAGPGERFITMARAAQERGIPFHAKAQLGATHELCTVPNLPLVPNLHRKFVGMYEHGAQGCMGTWTIGLRLTLNTYAMRLFLRDPKRFADASVFLDAVARSYFDLEETDNVIGAWQRFCDAFALYPFSSAMLYRGPHNDAPGRPLSLNFRGQALGSSFADAPMGDDLARCLERTSFGSESYELHEVIESFAEMSKLWDDGLASYESALSDADVSTAVAQHRFEELSCARMIGVHFHSLVHVFTFYREQLRVMAAHGLEAPCQLPRDPALLQIMRDEIQNAQRALSLAEADSRLGHHHEFGGRKYSAESIREKIAVMTEELGA